MLQWNNYAYKINMKKQKYYALPQCIGCVIQEYPMMSNIVHSNMYAIMQLNSSSAIADRYIGVELKDRVNTARGKTWGGKL